MRKNNICESKILYDNITKYSGSEIADNIAYGMDQPQSSTEKAQWVRYISSKLEEHFDERTIKNIRMGCYCNENGKLEESKEFIKNIFLCSSSMHDFADKMNEHGAKWYIEDGNLFTKYFSCPCPMLESIDYLPTKTWCYCTVGYNKEIFEYVFDCEVDVELIESIKTGSKQCLMKIIAHNKDVL